jgi:uncharacterized protein
MSTTVLIAGVSTRAMAESAARAGYEVIALDAFGDLDLGCWATARSLPRDFGVPFSAAVAARIARGIDCALVAYVASFENHPRAVRALAAGRELLGNPAAVLEHVRDPLQLARTLRRRGLPCPAVRLSPPARGADRRRWLVKPRASGGGHGITAWHGGSGLPRSTVLQERIAGVSGSIVFAAAGRRAVPLGLSRQLVGGTTFGAGRFRYAGSILAGKGDPQFAEDDALLAAAAHLAQVVTEEFDLIGVNGIDFIARGGVPFPVEVNPRYSASMELVERAYGISVFGCHARACRGELPDFDLGRARQHAAALGKAIVYARRGVTAGDTSTWLGDDSVRDVPHPGERISRRRPICTIFATGTDAAACAEALVRRSALVYGTLEAQRRSA